jgi:branched-subunit amino acid transport protein
MRLAIADPPYLGRAEMWYGQRSVGLRNDGTIGHGKPGTASKADRHPDAAAWDDPLTHRALVRRLVADYDGWAIAMLPDNLHDYLRWVPRETRIAVWHEPGVMPTGSHPRRRWEAVLVSRCPGRRRVVNVPLAVGDVLTCSRVTGIPRAATFAGRKPRQWTEWVLAMLGYCPTHDTVDDLFHGSGAVSATLAQGRLIECKCAGVGV